MISYWFSSSLFRFIKISTILIIVFLCSGNNSVSAKLPKDKPLPPLKVLTLLGDTLSLNDICKEKPTFIYFWATWCKVCSKSIKNVVDLEKEYGDKIGVFGVAWKDSSQAIKDYFEKRKDFMLSYIDSDGSVFDRLKIKQTPTVLIVSSDGNIVYQGYGSFRTFKREIKKQLKKE
jgi:thiol-disulfide isomerase/thioredoxin